MSLTAHLVTRVVASSKDYGGGSVTPFAVASLEIVGLYGGRTELKLHAAHGSQDYVHGLTQAISEFNARFFGRAEAAE